MTPVHEAYMCSLPDMELGNESSRKLVGAMIGEQFTVGGEAQLDVVICSWPRWDSRLHETGAIYLFRN